MLLAEDPVAGLRKMAGNGNNGAAVPTLGKEPLIEAADVGVAMGLKSHRAIGRFDKSPFQILIDETRDAAESRVPAAGKHPRHKPRVTRQIFSASKAVDIADLQPDHGCENLANSGYAE